MEATAEVVQSESQVIHPLEVLVLNKKKNVNDNLILLSAYLAGISRKIQKKSDLKLFYYEDETRVAAGVSNSVEKFNATNEDDVVVELDKTKVLELDYKGSILENLKNAHKKVTTNA